MRPRICACWLLAAHLGMAMSVSGQTRPSESLLRALEPSALRALATEVLERNPDVARHRHHAAALAVRAPRVRALPDPVAAVTLFVLPPETRVGPQRLSASISQKLPWFGKLALAEQAALYAAAAAEAEVEAQRLDALTEARRLFYELAFVDRRDAIVRSERDALVRYEEAARARYSAGAGLQQEIVRIQVQITRSDEQLLQIAERRASLLAALNALRDRPADETIDGISLPMAGVVELGADLREGARARRPEVAAADARIAASKTRVELARKNFRPDLTVGLGYTLVEGRRDAAGRATPPEDDGDDILALTGAVNLPVRRRKLEAGLEESLAMERAAVEDRRRVMASIEGSIGDLAARLPLLFEHWKLLEGVLRVQAREAMRSAEAAYSTGKLNAVDLLDAEVVLFDVRTAAARTLTDWAVTHAELERAMAGPLSVFPEDPDHE